MPIQTVDVSADPEGRVMNEPGRWVSKAEAARELEISLSTLDRMIRKGEVEVVREGRRVYVRMHGPEYLSDDELLRHAIMREDELERTVRELKRSALELEEERDEAGKPHTPAERPMRSWVRRIGRSGPRTERRGNWQAGWEWPSPGWSWCWSSALLWRGN